MPCMFASSRGRKSSSRELLGGIWLVPYLGVILVVSLLGTYGGGLKVIPAPWDSILAGATALGFYFVGVRAGLWYTANDDWQRAQEELHKLSAVPATAAPIPAVEVKVP